MIEGWGTLAALRSGFFEGTEGGSAKIRPPLADDDERYGVPFTVDVAKPLSVLVSSPCLEAFLEEEFMSFVTIPFNLPLVSPLLLSALTRL